MAEVKKHLKVIFATTTLAQYIGVEEAMFLQRVKYLSDEFGELLRGNKGFWVQSTIDAWHEQFLCWSKAKLIRIIKTLEGKGLLLSKKPNAKIWNQTKWYCVDIDALPSKIANNAFVSAEEIDKQVV